jgi:hypothetical protein
MRKLRTGEGVEGHAATQWQGSDPRVNKQCCAAKWQLARAEQMKRSGAGPFLQARGGGGGRFLPAGPWPTDQARLRP